MKTKKKNDRLARLNRSAFSILSYLENQPNPSQRKADLANLRNSIGRDLSDSPKVWPLIFSYIDDDLLGRGEESYGERALFNTLQLYALMEQGREGRKEEDVEDPDFRYMNFGQSLKSLRTGDDKAVDRRFNAMITSTNYDELINHLRQMVKLLKAKSQAKINYPLLAEDLYLFQAGSEDRVRLKWARSYYYVENKRETEEIESDKELNNDK